MKAEIAIIDNNLVLYKFSGDLMFLVTVSQEENELLMYTVLEGFHESISLLLRQVSSSVRPSRPPSVEDCCHLSHPRQDVTVKRHGSSMEAKSPQVFSLFVDSKSVFFPRDILASL